MCALYLKHTSLNSPSSSLGAIKYINTIHPANSAKGGSAVIIKETIYHYEETKFETEGIQATAVYIKARNYSIVLAGIYCPLNIN
jgi:hypothetical protein